MVCAIPFWKLQKCGLSLETMDFFSFFLVNLCMSGQIYRISSNNLNIAHWKSSPKYFVLFSYEIKNNHIKENERGLFKCSRFSSLINFHSLNRH